ncbi:MAG: hypothetical protein CMH64_01855 [Nanoarchaeota archaeon]|nr:hypothetical protein [Nanoarchaeota archaeon]|tara:strand:- start:3568 stop:4137 length:570 start_codon:yes stop_codon:yes gene_type:complete
MTSNFNVTLLTPYLSEDLGEHLTREEVLEHIILYGHDPSNFSEERVLRTPERLVSLSSPSYVGSTGTLPRMVLSESDLVISGNTESAEETVRDLKDSGLIIARFSIFYGEPSGYTDNSPEASGYSLDIPKDVSTVRAMLTDDNLLNALTSENESRIRMALNDLNTNLDQPVLATPFLSEALINGETVDL